jgi:uncharacterized protein DUF4389
MADEPPRDYASETQTGRALEEHLKSRSTWLRLLFMLVMVVFYAVSRIVVTVVVVVQFLHVLFTGEPNPRLKEFGQSLAAYTFQILIYLTFNSEVRPFPFDAEWPGPHE